eukprot:TRINITY_DN1429_c1_g1_i2.p3 TRINITY_DN1429_c1_g1~~TRINITY_DN1429_c1_g1_i2.p3  ORF type:complete len:55 (+),score=4.56 TRINITY_DN1429_c1_g1_i2:325-489(+)
MHIEPINKNTYNNKHSAAKNHHERAPARLIDVKKPKWYLFKSLNTPKISDGLRG